MQPIVVDKEKKMCRFQFVFLCLVFHPWGKKFIQPPLKKYLTLFTHLCFWLQFLTPILSSYVDFTFVDLISLSHVLVLCSTNTSCGRQYHLRSRQTFADSFSHNIPNLASPCTVSKWCTCPKKFSTLVGEVLLKLNDDDVCSTF